MIRRIEEDPIVARTLELPKLHALDREHIEPLEAQVDYLDRSSGR